jgi:hypothetical protein
MLLKIITGIEYMGIIWAVNAHCADCYRFSAAHVRNTIGYKGTIDLISDVGRAHSIT